MGLRVIDVAKMEGVTPEAVYYWIKTGRLAATWERGHLEIRRSDYRRFNRPAAGRRRKPDV